MPDFAALRANGVVYASKGINFGSVRPGDWTTRQLLFEGICCQDISRLWVLGGDRCEMGELNKFTDVKGLKPCKRVADMPLNINGVSDSDGAAPDARHTNHRI
jgi:hypothetical protein